MLAKDPSTKPIIGVLDDNVLLLNDILDELECAGYIAVGFANGHEALGFVNTNKLDLILCDVNMPVMNGQDFLKVLRSSDSSSKDTPFVFLTAQTNKEEMLEAYANGADDYICKPIDYDILLSKVSAILLLSKRKENQHQIVLQQQQEEIDSIRNELFSHAHFDQITKLPAKEHFTAKLNAELRLKEFALDGSILIVANITNFDHLNEYLKSENLKVLLQTLAERLETWLGKNQDATSRNNTVVGFSRIKKHFYIFIPSLFSDDTVRKICMDLTEYLEMALEFQNHKYHATINMGICFKTSAIFTANTLINNAEKALSKDQVISVYKDAGRSKTQNKSYILSQLENAIKTSQFYLEYQPKIDIKTNLIVGAEALIRWKQESGKILSPNDFLPLINRPDQMLSITKWVINECCQQISIWKLKEICISINILPSCLEDNMFSEILQSALDVTDIDPTLLEFELLETSMIANTDILLQNIQYIKKLGIKFSLDDFGTGFSNYDYMSHIQFDSLKIDKSIIDNIENNPQKKKIVESMIYLSRRLGMKSIAEGVESEMCLEVLRSLKCDQYQGFLGFRPLSADAFIKLSKQFACQH